MGSDASNLCLNGYLAPSGEFFECKQGQHHIDVARTIIQADREAFREIYEQNKSATGSEMVEKSGYIRIDNGLAGQWQLRIMTPTSAQYDKAAELGINLDARECAKDPYQDLSTKELKEALLGRGFSQRIIAAFHRRGGGHSRGD